VSPLKGPLQEAITKITRKGPHKGPHNSPRSAIVLQSPLELEPQGHLQRPCNSNREGLVVPIAKVVAMAKVVPKAKVVPNVKTFRGSSCKGTSSARAWQPSSICVSTSEQASGRVVK